MSPPLMHKLNRSSNCRKLRLAIAGIAAAVVSMITGHISISALAQTQTASTPVLSSEIAPIKADHSRATFPSPRIKPAVDGVLDLFSQKAHRASAHLE